MSCGSGRFTKERIIVLGSLGACIVTASYLAFTVIDGRVLVASSPLLGIAACPLMCAAVGGVVWVRDRIYRIKNKRMKINIKNKNSCNTKEDHETEQSKNLTVSQTLKKKNKNKKTSHDYT